ncbi:unnamed protein product [Phytophthora lilii]|uniref:Unnamed protein product n=1 Tax=Phytophthora lilii TaxID=2077276 RepID=A0A9W7CKT4_9STRA|nr:unnamed protein product [Phytophthora lilii]
MNRPGRFLAQRQLAARLKSEAEQTRFREEINSRTNLMQDFYRLVQERVGNLPVTDPAIDGLGVKPYQQKRIWLDPSDAEIFATYIRELDGIYAKTDETLRSWRMDSTEEKWDAPSEEWDDDVGSRYLRYRGKITIPFHYKDICQYRWLAAHLFHRQQSRELYDDVEDPSNTLALKYRVTTRLNSGEFASALQRIVIRRYTEDDRMLIVWRLFTEGEGVFDGIAFR